MKTLILYYSQAVGNTERIANIMQEKLNSDMEKIDTIKPYTGTYQEISDQGHREVNEGYKPEIKPINSNIDMYERIVIATPTWWYRGGTCYTNIIIKYKFRGKRSCVSSNTCRMARTLFRRYGETL